MAITLSEAAKLSQTYLQKGVIEEFVLRSNILDRLPLMEIAGNAFAYNAEGQLPNVSFRAVNGSYTESTGTVNQKTETLVILGDADVDRYIVKTRGDINDQRAMQTAMKVKSATFLFQDTFFNGDVAADPNSFDGLRKRLIGSQVITAGANGLNVLGSDNLTIHAFFDKLDELVAAVPGLDGTNGAIYANAQIIGKIKSGARRIGADVVLDADLNGKRVAMWNGIPILDAGVAPGGHVILPQTETQGSATTTSSIYAVKFGGFESEHSVTGLTNGGIQVTDLGELETKPAYRTRIEFYCGIAVFGGKAAARLSGVLNG